MTNDDTELLDWLEKFLSRDNAHICGPIAGSEGWELGVTEPYAYCVVGWGKTLRECIINGRGDPIP